MSTEPTTLTEAERASITRCIEKHGGVCREVMCSESLDETVRLIVAARLAESGKAGYERGWDAAVSEFRVNEPMRSDHPAIAATKAENARLRDTLARVEALVASLARGGFRDKAIAASLRAALAGGDSDA